MNGVPAFFAIWYEFIVGDDWRGAVGVIVALAPTCALLSAGVPVWWVLTVAVVILLPLSLWHVVRSRPRGNHAG